MGNAGGHACGVEWPSGDSIAGQIAGEESTQRLLMKQLILMAYCVATAARQMSQRGLKAGLGRALRLRRHKPGLCHICFV